MAADLSTEAIAFMAEPATVPPRAVSVADRAWFAVLLEPSPAFVGRFQSFATDFGYQTFAPHSRSVRWHQIRKRGSKPKMVCAETLTPLLGRYVLVRLPRYNTPFARFLTVPARWAGVTAFVGTREHGPTIIPDEIVSELQDREARGEFDATTRRGRRIVSKLPDWCVVGARVRVSSGAFAGYTGQVEEHAGDGRVRVTLTIFGRATPIELGVDQLEAVS